MSRETRIGATGYWSTRFGPSSHKPLKNFGKYRVTQQLSGQLTRNAL